MPVSEELKKKLRGMAGSFSKAQSDPSSHTTGYAEYDDGTYAAVIVKAEFGESAAGRDQIVWGYMFTEGKYANQIKYEYMGLDRGEESWKWVFRRVHQYGVDASQLTIDELPELLDLIVESKVQVVIRLKTTKNKDTGAEFQNVYVNKVLTPLAVGAEDVGETPAQNDTTASSAVESQSGIKIADRVRVVINGVETVGLVREIGDDGMLKVFAKGDTHTVHVDDCTPA